MSTATGREWPRLGLAAFRSRIVFHGSFLLLALATMFDYGVSDQQGEADTERRGQGLFVAKPYLAKMDGTISARNTADGVVFELGLPMLS